MKAPDESFTFFFSGEKFKEGVKTGNSTVIRRNNLPYMSPLNFWNFVPSMVHCLGPVHTYPDIFESATFSFRIVNIRVHTLCDHSVLLSNSPVHAYSDSLRIHWGFKKLSHQALVRPGLTQNRWGRHCFSTRLSCFCRPFCPVDNVKSLQMSSHLLA